MQRGSLVKQPQRPGDNPLVWAARNTKPPTDLSLREIARAFGCETFEPLAACTRGHHGPRNTKYGYCIACHRERAVLAARSRDAQVREARERAVQAAKARYHIKQG